MTPPDAVVCLDLGGAGLGALAAGVGLVLAHLVKRSYAVWRGPHD